jgi:hypothetical protein
LAQETDNRVLVKYLFGELAEPEQSRIEELCFTDESFYEQLASVEDSLIDRYVQNALPEPERSAFEEKYLVIPGRRKRVEESEKLINLIISYPSDSPKASWWKYLLGFFEGRNLFLQFSLTAALMALIVGCVWLMRDRARLAEEAEQTQALLRQKELELQRQDEAHRKAVEQLRAESGGAQSQNGQDEQLLEGSPKGAQPSREPRQNNRPRTPAGPSVAAYVFPLVTVRGAQSQKPLIIRAGQESARLVVYIKNNSYKKFHVSVQRVSGEKVWDGTVSKGQSTSTGERISFELPASVFKKKDYIMVVDALKPDGSIENLDTRSFSVINEQVRNN